MRAFVPLPTTERSGSRTACSPCVCRSRSDTQGLRSSTRGSAEICGPYGGQQHANGTRRRRLSSRSPMTTHTARGGAGRGVLTEEFRQPHSFRSGRSPAQRQSSGAPDDYVQDLDGAVLIAFPDILVRNVPARLRAALAAAAPRPGPLEFPRLHTLQPGAAHPLFAAYWHSNTAFPRPAVLNCSRQNQGPAGSARARSKTAGIQTLTTYT